jgi:hypothetical protein
MEDIMDLKALNYVVYKGVLTSLLLIPSPAFAGMVTSTSGLGVTATASGLGTYLLSGTVSADPPTCPGPPYYECENRASASVTIDATTSGPPTPGYLDLFWWAAAEGDYTTGTGGGSIVGMFGWYALWTQSPSGHELIPYTLGTPFQIQLSATGVNGCYAWNLASPNCTRFYNGIGSAQFQLSVRDGSPTGFTVPILDAVPEPGGMALVGLLFLAAGKWLARNRAHRNVMLS